MIQSLLGCHGKQNHDHRPDVRLLKLHASGISHKRLDSFITDDQRHNDKKRRHQKSRERLELPISVRITAVGSAKRNPHKHQHNQVGGKIIQRMEPVGNKCVAVPVMSRYHLQHHQNRIYYASYAYGPPYFTRIRMPHHVCHGNTMTMCVMYLI